MSVHLDLRRCSRIAGAVAASAGALSWAAFLSRLQLRGLHILQLEGYQTGRYLDWNLQQPGRWASKAAFAGGLGAVALAGLDLATRRASGSAGAVSQTRGVVGGLLWGALGGLLWWAARPPEATKPLVLTARAKRLLAGQGILTTLFATGPAAVCAMNPATRPYALPALMLGGAAASLLTPPLVAGANLLLWPVEEGFRRYYLADARRKLRAVDPIVVGVAGSYGKTSTKELTATILSSRWSVLKPPGSFNTPMGISRILREQLQPSHEVFVAELGDYVPGDIRFLCNLVGPRVGILTAIGPEHLERFKTMDRIVQAKAELYDALPLDGVAIVNQDDPRIRALGDRAATRGLRVMRYGQTEPGAQVRARDVRTTRDGLSFTIEADGHGETELAVGLLGRHNVMNLLAATAAALALGMTLPEIARAAKRVTPVEHRLQPIQGAGGVLVIDDTYNSNPSGAAEALRVLGELPGGQKVLVTPGMIELAEREDEEHRLLGQRAAAVCDTVILVGPERTRPIAQGLRDAGFPAERLHVVPNRDAATAQLGTLLRSGDVVLWENDLPDTYAEDAIVTPVGGREASVVPKRDAGVPSQGAGVPSQGAGVPSQGADTPSQGAGAPSQGAGAINRAPTTPNSVGARFIAPSAIASATITPTATALSATAPTATAPSGNDLPVAPERSDGGPHAADAGPGDLGSTLLPGYSSIVVDGLRIVYREDGLADAPPVVVLHGWGASIAAVLSIQAAFRATHRTIALDLPGFGASDPPPVPWGAEEYAALVRSFLARLGISRAHFIGHSHGGRVSIVLAATHPELVDRLVLVDSAGIRPKRTLGYYARVYSYKASRHLLTLPLLAGPLGAPLRRIFETRAGSDDFRQAGSMRGTLVRVVNEDWRHLLPRIAASTLLIWGECDDSTPLADGQLMERHIPDAGLVIFPGAGHFAYADDPDRFARVVGHFLARSQETGVRSQEI